MSKGRISVCWDAMTLKGKRETYYIFRNLGLKRAKKGCIPYIFDINETFTNWLYILVKKKKITFHQSSDFSCFFFFFFFFFTSRFC